VYILHTMSYIVSSRSLAKASARCMHVSYVCIHCMYFDCVDVCMYSLYECFHLQTLGRSNAFLSQCIVARFILRLCGRWDINICISFT
jgi:hypothetical protein